MQVCRSAVVANALQAGIRIALAKQKILQPIASAHASN